MSDNGCAANWTETTSTDGEQQVIQVPETSETIVFHGPCFVTVSSDKPIDAQTLREKFADLAHRQWSGWMEYLFEKSTKNEDGTVTIPKWAVDRWTKQIKTDYKDLSQQEQDSDRTEADKFLAILMEG
jgi:hypothetical protein